MSTRHHTNKQFLLGKASELHILIRQLAERGFTDLSTQTEKLVQDMVTEGLRQD